MPIFINSFPKSGTHLIDKLLFLWGFSRFNLSLADTSLYGRHYKLKQFIRGCNWGDCIDLGLFQPTLVSSSWIRRKISSSNPNNFFTGHARLSPELSMLLNSFNIPTIYITRNTADTLLSFIKYFRNSNVSPYSNAISSSDINVSALNLLDCSSPSLRSFKDSFLLSRQWLFADNTFVLSFEDLIGPQGGGDSSTQYESLSNLYDWLLTRNIPLEVTRSDAIDIAVDNLFGGTKTFRSGKVGSGITFSNTVLSKLDF